MLGVNADENVVTMMSKKSTPFTDSDRKDYRGPLKILRRLDMIREHTTEYISARQLAHYNSICAADPDTGRPCMWGCEHCNWRHLQEEKQYVTALDRLPARPIAGVHDECKCQHARHAMQTVIYNRNTRHRQALLKGMQNQLKHPNAIRHRGMTLNDPASAAVMFSNMDMEGGEVFTRLHASATEMTWCPCVVYAKGLKAIITELCNKKLKGIHSLGGIIMAHLFGFTKLPADLAFDRACEDPDLDTEDVAYFIDVRWVEE